MTLSDIDCAALDFLKMNPAAQEMLDLIHQTQFEATTERLALQAGLSEKEAAGVIGRCVEYGVLIKREGIDDTVFANFSSDGRQLYTIFVLQRATHQQAS